MKVAALLFGLVAVGCASLFADDGIEKPLAPDGDAARGRTVFIARDGGHCVLCHAAPGISPAGNVGPSLAGVASRLTPAQIRLRIADITRVNAKAAMPAFHRVEGLTRVAPEYAGKPVLTGRQVEDLVAWLSTLR
ncbi:MAG TPA: sulfur oxidation c-type cytochrome SoxX [Usitatibacter sp.]|nr:sulfur oxidation c-type cytochrome SoxX [Usitatibacter sp.]